MTSVNAKFVEEKTSYMSNDKWLITSQKTSETTVMLVTVLKVKTWDDYHALTNAIFLEAGQNNGNVDVILDTRNNPIPSQTPLAHFQKTAIMWENYPNIKSFVIIVKLPFLVEPFARMVMNLVKAQRILEYTKSVEDAMLKIQARYQVLKDHVK